MQNAKEFFASLFGGAKQPVFVYTAQGLPIFCNRSAAGLLTRWKMTEAQVYTVFSADARVCLREQAGRAVGACFDREAVDLYLTPYFYNEETWLVARVEQTAVSGLEQDLMRVLRNSGAKMNSYLNGIYGTAQRLGLQTEEGARLGRDVHQLLRMKNHLYQLLDRTGIKEYLVPIELGSFMQEYVRSVLELKPDLPIRVADVPADLFVRIMPEDMELVLSVLISNACRFGEGEIVLSAERKEGSICLTVADNGPGVADPSRLFEWGYRTADRKGVSGLGFSLAMARQLLVNQGAALEYARVGAQTCFTVALEPSDLPAGSVLAEWSAEPLENSLSQLRIELSDIL